MVSSRDSLRCSVTKRTVEDLGLINEKLKLTVFRKCPVASFAGTGKSAKLGCLALSK